MFDEAKARVKLGKYVQAHTDELDTVMKLFFEQWNEIGKLSSESDESNKMQVTWLISIFKIILNKSGMPKPVQRQNLEVLLKNL